MAKYRKDEIPQLCRNCKWWDKGFCSNARLIADIGATYSKCEYIETRENFTREDFGCIHWEGK